MTTITLTNDFHRTTTTVRLRPVGGHYVISKRAARDANRKLCGISGCCCGDTFGARGGTILDLVSDDDASYIVAIRA